MSDYLENKTEKRFCWIQRKSDNKQWYISDTPAGVMGWEWADDLSDAIELSPYWQKRFRRDCERSADVPRFMTKGE